MKKRHARKSRRREFSAAEKRARRTVQRREAKAARRFRRVPRHQRAWVSRKIRHLIKVEHKPHKQAIAIALSMAARNRQKYGRKKRRRR